MSQRVWNQNASIVSHFENNLPTHICYITLQNREAPESRICIRFSNFFCFRKDVYLGIVAHSRVSSHDAWVSLTFIRRKIAKQLIPGEARIWAEFSKDLNFNKKFQKSSIFKTLQKSRIVSSGAVKPYIRKVFFHCSIVK